MSVIVHKQLNAACDIVPYCYRNLNNGTVLFCNINYIYVTMVYIETCILKGFDLNFFLLLNM